MLLTSKKRNYASIYCSAFVGGDRVKHTQTAHSIIRLNSQIYAMLTLIHKKGKIKIERLHEISINPTQYNHFPH